MKKSFREIQSEAALLEVIKRNDEWARDYFKLKHGANYIISELNEEIRQLRSEPDDRWHRAAEALPVSSSVHCEVITEPRLGLDVAFARYYDGENVWGGYYVGETGQDLSMPVIWWREFVRPKEAR